MNKLTNRDIQRIRKLLRKGNSELHIAPREGYALIFGYVSMESILSIAKEGYCIYHSKMNDSAMMVCRI